MYLLTIITFDEFKFENSQKQSLKAELGIKSLTNWKSYSQSQSKWTYNHDLKSLACTHNLKRIGIAKSVKISTLLSNHFPNKLLYTRLRELHNWNFPIFKKCDKFAFSLKWANEVKGFENDLMEIKSNHWLWVANPNHLGISLFQIPILVWLGGVDCKIGFDSQLC